MEARTSTSAGKKTESPSVRFLKGIGPRRYESLKRLGIETLHDLCYFFPRRYEDRSHFQKIRQIKPNTFVTIAGKVVTAGIKPLKRVSLIELWLEDETGVIQAIWFNQPYLKNNFPPGSQLILSGKAEFFQNRLQLISPEYEILDTADEDPVHTGRITPIYPLTEGLFQRSLRVAMKELTDRHINTEIAEYLPRELATRYHFPDLPTAMKEIHFPSTLENLESARHRLIFDDFFLFQLALFRKVKQIREKYRSEPIQARPISLKTFEEKLSFLLTRDQTQAVAEICGDLSQRVPMTRLLQGEVGSGKTVVAAYATLCAADSGFQSAFLIPTEVLAEQHAVTLTKLLEPYGKKVHLLTASVVGAERDQILSNLAKGKIDVLVGTHALLQEAVTFNRLGFVVIDEQHKFGVRQRAQLLQRSPRPHLLVMSATPIPRTLGLTLYGDLDISTIRELPKGRKPIVTQHVTDTDERRVFQIVKERISASEQAYLILPVIEETERTDLQAAVQEYKRLGAGEFRSISIGLVHGRMSKDERDRAMRQFQEGKIKLLIATSVVEVGVDNPNATVMMVRHADRFGLSQLHQIRGRIGRGTQASVCFLFADPKTEEAKQRLEVLTKTQDGFVIAEEDLKLRGPGEFFGVRQSGAPIFRLADLARDAGWLLKAREEAKRILEDDPQLARSEHQRLLTEIG